MKQVSQFWSQLIALFSRKTETAGEEREVIGRKRNRFRRLFLGRQTSEQPLDWTGCFDQADRCVRSKSQPPPVHHRRNSCLLSPSTAHCHERRYSQFPITEIITEEEETIETMPRKPPPNMDQIEPFQPLEELGSFWQQPKEPLEDSMSKFSMPILLSDHYPSQPPPPVPAQLVPDGRRSSASNILRSHNLRSSCPPTARRRRKLSSVTSAATSIPPSSLASTTVASSSIANVQNSGLVDTIHSKLSAVRKSWLFSIFQPAQSKEKQSKWTKSNDFEAEFFDRHTELTENLLNRRSPLDVPNLNAQSSRNIHQMAYNAPPVESHFQNKASFLRSPSVLNGFQPGAGSRKPRPRSACLDTYMLRMRNGNYLEYSLDEDETCSIISAKHPTVIHQSSELLSSIVDKRPALLSSPLITSSSHSSSSGDSNRRSSHCHSDSITTRSSPSPFPRHQAARISAAVTTTTSSASPMVATTSNATSSLSSASFSSGNLTAWCSKPINMAKVSNINSVLVYSPMRDSTEIPIDTNTTASDVIRYILTSRYVSVIQPNSPTTRPVSHNYSYALRLVCRGLNPNDHQWLHATQNMHQFADLNRSLFERGWRLELRIRYIPFNVDKLCLADLITFNLLYQQTLEEFLALENTTANAMLLNHDTIIELGCLELRRNKSYLTPHGLEKNFDTVESEMNTFLPPAFVSMIKPKQLRKLIKNKFKKIYPLPIDQVMVEFLHKAKPITNYQRELFHCSLGESAWCVPVDLVIGPDVGIAYFTNTSLPPTVIVKSFDLIEEVHIVSHVTTNSRSTLSDRSDDLTGSTMKKILLNLRITNEPDLLVISCNSFASAQSIADLIDGYHRLATESPTSIWLNLTSSDLNGSNGNQSSKQSSLRSNVSDVIEPKKAQFELISPSSSLVSDSSIRSTSTNGNQVNGNQSLPKADTAARTVDEDYSNPTECCSQIYREKLRIDDLVGKGQFGDVHKGVYFKPNENGEETIPVAIKISRVQYSAFGHNDIFSADQKLLCEAERMNQLDHENIIKLIGVCPSSPVYVVMELAEYGELRDFLQKHGPTLEHRRLLEYSYQIACAMTYLESKQFVHRDIAARNVLVFSFETVKLADFGLSRYIDDTSYYMATTSKLPIKWMAPESINFRRFTTASDVWMFAVCVWEIFMLGKKPFPKVKNSDVIGLIECGERLPRPSRCPEHLYQLLHKCWRYEPHRRPTFRYIKRTISEVYQQEIGFVGAIARIDLNNTTNSSSVSTLSSSLSGYNDRTMSSTSSAASSHRHLTTDRHERNMSRNTSQSSIFDAEKIKAILSEQRKQMEEDQRWLAENEMNWQKNPFDSLSRSSVNSSTEPNNSTSTSVYEDADSQKNDEQHSSLEVHSGSTKWRSNGDGSYSSKSSSIANSKHLSSSSDSSISEHCGLSVSLKKFFKHNQLKDVKVRKEMMDRIDCSSAELDRRDDQVYWSTISVVNSVRHLLKGVQQLDSEHYIDLVKNVGLELRNLLANVDQLLTCLPDHTHWDIGVAQKKLSTDMNELVESMKKTIMYSDSPMQSEYKQNMLESAYVLVIDSKNLLDTLDEIRIDQSSDVNSNSEPEEEPTTSSVTTSCSTPMNSEQMMLPNKPHEF